MLQADDPGTFVLATNRTETVRDFVNMSFKAVGIEVDWVGEGVNERGLCASDGRELVRVNPRFFRPAEVDMLKGDPSKAKAVLGWEPKTTLEDLCFMMVAADMERNQRALLAEAAANQDSHIVRKPENRPVYLGGARELESLSALMQRP
jgi:GDPmannose 4,6-dehydratase